MATLQPPGSFLPLTGGTISGNLTVSGTLTGTIGGTTAAAGTFTTLTSVVGTGTPPITVSSTTPVANLSIGGNAATATTVTGTINSSVTATTQASNNNSTKVATTAYVDTAVPVIASGTYMPSLTNLSNCSLSTPTWTYKRIGNTVTVFGVVNITYTTSGNWSFNASLPVASNLSNGVSDLGGAGFAISGHINGSGIYGDATNHAAKFAATVSAGTTDTHAFNFTYIIN